MNLPGASVLSSPAVAVLNIVLSALSALLMTIQWVAWVDNVEARGSYSPSSFSRIVTIFYFASIVLASVLFVSGFALWDKHRWAQTMTLATCSGVLSSQVCFWIAGAILARERPDWPEVLALSFFALGIYSIV